MLKDFHIYECQILQINSVSLIVEYKKKMTKNGIGLSLFIALMYGIEFTTA